MVPILRDPEGLFDNEGIPKGFSYIHDGYFYLGQGTEIIEKDNKEKEEITLPPIKQSKYNFSQKYPNLTNNYIPTESCYSSELHEYLGEYLRAYRDTYKIDLMGLYNCFSNRLISKVSLPMAIREENTQGSSGLQATSFTTWYQFKDPNDNYKITCFPIKFNMEYKIKIYGAINGTVTLQPIFYHDGDYLRLVVEQINDNKPLVFNSEARVYDNNLTYRLNLKDTINKFSPAPVIDPNLKPEEKQQEQKQLQSQLKKYLIENEKYLYLFVQVPQSQDLQISVIEEAEYFQVTNNTLLNLNGIDYNVPFSDRLLEFLTENVITPYDPIKQDITRVQTILLSSDFKRKYYRELFNSPLYTAIYNREATKEKPYTEKEKQDAVIRGHYNKLKRFINLTDEEKQDNNGKDIQIPSFNIIIADKVKDNDNDETYSSVPYYPTPGEYDDTMRVILYSIFNNVKIGNGEQNILDFTGYVDKDVENLLMKCVVSKELKQRLMEI